MPTVQDTLLDAASVPMKGATVEIALVASAEVVTEGRIASTQSSVVGAHYETCDDDGHWTATLTANALMVPAGTVYRLRYRKARSSKWLMTDYITVPNDSNAHWVQDILTDPPSDVISPDLSGYQTRSEKNVANGYAGLNANARVGQAQLGAGGGSGTKFLRDDNTWQDGTGVANAVQYENMTVIPAATGVVNLDVSLYNVFDVTLAGTGVVFNPINEEGTHSWSFTVILRQDATGGRSSTWQGFLPYKWPGGLPPQLSTAPNKIDVLTFITVDAGATWLGFVAGQDMR